MACFHPNEVWRYFDPIRQQYVNDFSRSPCPRPGAYRVLLPCGQCMGCRIEKSRQWAIRAVHEAQLHEENCFITLTYAPEYLPEDGSVHVEELKKFWKRLRKRFCIYDGEGNCLNPIRYIACGEYGAKLSRPHYHAVIFGFDFPDKELFCVRGGNRVYISKALQELWPFGISSIGSCSFESCAYVARYCTKKITGKKAKEHYQGRKPEFFVMSRNPGIASGWLEKYHDDVYPHDFIVTNKGKKIRVPRFYDKKMEVIDPETFAKTWDDRQNRLAEWTESELFLGFTNEGNRVYKGLAHIRKDREVSKEIKEKRFKRLVRNFENGE